MSKHWYRAKANASGSVASIAILSDIGAFGVSAQSFFDDMQALGEPEEIRLSINSNGGDIATGFAIYNFFARHPAHKVVTIEGIAASMGSVVAMAGDEIVMPENTMMMIHNPLGSITGGDDEIASFADALKDMKMAMAKTYQDRSGKSLKEVLAMMDRETWLTAKAAKAAGFADRIEKPMAMSGYADISRFNHPPAVLIGRTNKAKETAMAKAKGTEDEDNGDNGKTEAEIRTELLASQNEIRAVCSIAGKPDAATAYITAGKTVSEVVADLEAKREAAAKAAKDDADKRGKGKGKSGTGTASDEVSAHHTTGKTSELEVAVIDPDKIWGKWNSAGKKS